MRLFEKLVITVSLMSVSGPVFATTDELGSLTPILSLDSDVETLPFLDLALRDPVIDLRAANAQDATMLLQKIAELEEKLEKAPSKRTRLKLTNEIFRYYLTLVAYTEDVDHFLIDDKRVGRHDEMRALLLKYATRLAALTKDPEDRIQARYHVIVSKLLSGKTEEAFAELTALGEVKGRQATNFELLRAMAELRGSEQEAGRARLTKIFPKLNPPGSIVAMLLIARSLAGLDHQGAPMAEAMPEYRRYLIAATKRAAYLSESMRSEVFSYALGVWRGAEGGTEDWQKPAIAAALVKGLDEQSAVEERLAIRAAVAGAFGEAIQRYGRVISAHKRLPELARLTERVLDLHALQADKTGDVKKYGAALNAAERRFAAKDVLGKDHVKTAQAYGEKFRARYRAMVMANLDRAIDESATASTRKAAFDLTRDYLGRSRPETDKVEVQTKLAQVHTAGGQFGEAASIYLSLNERLKGAESRKFLRLAIEAQSALAKWPLMPPWDETPAGPAPARMALAGMYEDLNEFTKSQDWAVLAHIGLLRVNIGRAKDTYSLWLATLKDGPRGEDASRAAGWLLQTARAGKKWGDLVYIVNQIQVHKIVPTDGRRDLDPTVALADGLYHGGHAAFKKGEYAAASKFFDGFVKQFPTDERYVDALFHRGKTLVSNENVAGALAIMREIVREHGTSRYAKDAVIEGRKLAESDNDRMFFMEAYLRDFPKATGVLEVRTALAEIYLKTSNHEGASKLIFEQAQDNRVDLDARQEAYAKVMEIEEKHGTIEMARKAAEALATLARDDQAFMAKVVAFQARDAHRQGKMGALDSFEKRLTAFDDTQREVVEALAQVRYLIVLRDAEKIAKKTTAETVQDPVKEVQVQVSTYQDLRRRFEGVCELGVQEYCDAAKQSLSEVSQRAIDAIRVIRPAVTMDQKAVDGFENQKAKIMEIMSQTVVGRERLMGRN